MDKIEDTYIIIKAQVSILIVSIRILQNPEKF